MIKLEKFTSQHYATLISWVSCAEDLMQFAGSAYRFSLTHEQLDESLLDPNRYAFSVYDSETKLHIGHGQLYVNDATILLGRILIGEPSLRGRGIGKQIVQSLLKFGFNNFPQTTAELNVFDWNLSAIECYKRVGFTLNPMKNVTRMIKDETWTALNMILEKERWTAPNAQ